MSWLLLVFKKQSKMHRLNIVQSSMQSRSRSVLADGSGQGASWQTFVWILLAQRHGFFEKCTNWKLLKPTLTITMPLPPMLWETFTPCYSCLLKQLWQNLTSPKRQLELRYQNSSAIVVLMTTVWHCLKKHQLRSLKTLIWHRIIWQLNVFEFVSILIDST